MAGRAVRAPMDWSLAAVRLYAFLIPLQPVFTMPDGSPLRFAAADAAAPFVVLAALAWPRRRLPAGLAGVALAIPMLALFSTLWAGETRSLSYYALGKTAGLFYLTGVAFAATRCLPRDAMPAVLRALGAGAVWSAVIGLLAFAAFLAGTETALVWGGRLCSTMLGDPNIYCSLLAIGLLVQVTDTERPGAVRLVRAAILVLALLATGSRSGLVGLSVGIVVLAGLRARDPWVGVARGAAALAVAGLGVAGFLLTDAGHGAAVMLWEHVWRRWTVESRFDLYARALEQFGDHPLLGVGIGGFNDLNTFFVEGRLEHFAVHNTYLWALVDLGIGGVLVSVLIAWGIVACALAARRRPPVAGAAVVAAGLATMAAFNLFIDGFYQRHFWLLMACALGTVAAPRVRMSPAWSSPARSVGLARRAMT